MGIYNNWDEHQTHLHDKISKPIDLNEIVAPEPTDEFPLSEGQKVFYANLEHNNNTQDTPKGHDQVKRMQGQ